SVAEEAHAEFVDGQVRPGGATAAVSRPSGRGRGAGPMLGEDAFVLGLRLLGAVWAEVDVAAAAGRIGERPGGLARRLVQAVSWDRVAGAGHAVDPCFAVMYRRTWDHKPHSRPPGGKLNYFGWERLRQRGRRGSNPQPPA